MTASPLPAEQLGTDEDGRALHAGRPFTGVAQQHDDEGHLIAEDTYRDGLRHGPARLLYPSGTLAEEGTRRRGAWHGTVETWNEDGTQAEEGRYAYGICLEHWVWDDQGDLVEHFQLDPDSEMMEIVRQSRAEDPEGADG